MSQTLEQQVAELKAVVVELVNIVESKTNQEVSNIFTIPKKLRERSRLGIFEKREADTLDARLQLIQTEVNTLYTNVGLAIQNAVTQNPELLEAAIDNAVQGQITDATTNISNLQSELLTETTNRTNADSTLQNNIDNLTSSVNAEFNNTNIANKILRLGPDGKVPISLIDDSKYDDVITGTFGSFPAETGKIYIDTTTKKIYYYDGAIHQELAKTIESINNKIGAVVLDADDIDDTTTTHKFTTVQDKTKIDDYLSIFNTADKLVKLQNNGMIDPSLYVSSAVASVNGYTTNNITLTTDDITEGTTNKYTTTDEKTKVADYLTSFNTASKLVQLDTNGKVPVNLLSSEVTSVNAQVGDVVLNSDNITEGTTNKYVTTGEKSNLAILGIYNQANKLVQLNGSAKIDPNLYDGANTILTYTNLVSLPVTGDTTKLYYITADTKLYRWDGSQYLSVSQPTAVGAQIDEYNWDAYGTGATGVFNNAAFVSETATYIDIRPTAISTSYNRVVLFKDQTVFKGLSLSDSIIYQISMAQSYRFQPLAYFDGAENVNTLAPTQFQYEILETGATLQYTLNGATGYALPKYGTWNGNVKLNRITIYINYQEKKFRLWSGSSLAYSLHGQVGQTIVDYQYDASMNTFFANVNTSASKFVPIINHSVDFQTNFLRMYSFNDAYTYLDALTFTDPSPLDIITQESGLKYLHFRSILENTNPVPASAVDLSNYYTKSQSDQNYVSVNTNTLTNYYNKTYIDSNLVTNTTLGGYTNTVNLLANHYTKSQTDNLATLVNFYNKSTSDGRYVQSNSSPSFATVTATTMNPSVLNTNTIQSSPSGGTISVNGSIQPISLITNTINSSGSTINFSNKQLTNVNAIEANTIKTKSIDNVVQTLFIDNKNTTSDNRIVLERHIDGNVKNLTNINDIQTRTIKTINSVDSVVRSLFIDDNNPATNNVIKCARNVDFQGLILAGTIKATSNGTNAININSSDIIFHKTLNMGNNQITNVTIPTVNSTTISNSGLTSTNTLSSSGMATLYDLSLSNRVKSHVIFEPSAFLKSDESQNAIYGPYVPQFNINNIYNLTAYRLYAESEMYTTAINGPSTGVTVSQKMTMNDKILVSSYLDASSTKSYNNNYASGTILADVLTARNNIWATTNMNNANSGVAISPNGLRIGTTNIDMNGGLKLGLVTSQQFVTLSTEYTGTMPIPVRFGPIDGPGEYYHSWNITNTVITEPNFNSIVSIEVYYQKPDVFGAIEWSKLTETNGSISYFMSGAIVLKFYTSSTFSGVSSSTSDYTGRPYKVQVVYRKGV